MNLLFPEKMHFHMFPVASLQAKGAVITLKMTFDRDLSEWEVSHRQSCSLLLFAARGVSS